MASLACPGGKNYGVGGCSPKEIQLLGTVWAAVQARLGSPRDPAPGIVVAAGGDAGSGCSSFCCGFRGGVGSGALSGGCRQPALIPPVHLPEGSVQLLQLGAEWQANLQVHAEGLQPLLQLAERRPEEEGGTCGSSAGPVITTPTPPPATRPIRVPHHSPLLGIQVTAAHGNGEEARGAGGGAVAVQEAPDIEAEVSGAGQVVGVSAHSADNLGETKPNEDPNERP